MKRILNLRNVVKIGVACLAVVVMFSSCGKDNGKNVTGVELNLSSSELEVGKTLILTATVLPKKAENTNVSWVSDNPQVATVENGLVMGVSEGKATITVVTEDGLKTATCIVTVTPPRGMSLKPGIRSVLIKLAGTGTVTIYWGHEGEETYTLSAEPFEYQHEFNGFGNTITFIGNNITYLDCSRNMVDILNVNNNPALKELNCRYNSIKKLDVSRCTSLTMLNCDGNNFTNTELNALFGTLHGNPISGGKTIYIGYYDEGCDISIAEKKGWTVLER